MEKGNAAIQTPTTHDIEDAVALFAVSTVLTRLDVLERAVSTTIYTHTSMTLQDISGFSALNEFFSQQGGDGLGTMMSLVNMYFQQVRRIVADSASPSSLLIRGLLPADD